MRLFLMPLLGVCALFGAAAGARYLCLVDQYSSMPPMSRAEMLQIQQRKEVASDDIPRLVACFDHDDPYIRLTAAVTLGKIGPAAVEPVRGRLADRDAKVRLTALQALSYIGGPSAVALGDLQERLRDEDPCVRLKTIGIFVKLDLTTEAADGLARCLDDASPAVAEAALAAFTRLPAPPQSALPALVKLTAHQKPQARFWAYRVLSRMGDAGALALVEPLRRATQPDERMRLYSAATQLGPSAKPLLPQLQTVMIENAWWDGEKDLFTILKNCGADGAATLAAVLTTVHDPRSPHFSLGDDRARTLLDAIAAMGPAAEKSTPALLTLMNEQPTLRPATLDTLNVINPSALDVRQAAARRE